jgi:hypothetical protein
MVNDVLPEAPNRHILPGCFCLKTSPELRAETWQTYDIIEIAWLFALARFLQR